MNNEQEWRILLLSEIRYIKEELGAIQKEMTTLKVKVALFSSAISSVATLLFNNTFGQ